MRVRVRVRVRVRGFEVEIKRYMAGRKEKETKVMRTE